MILTRLATKVFSDSFECIQYNAIWESDSKRTEWIGTTSSLRRNGTILVANTAASSYSCSPFWWCQLSLGVNKMTVRFSVRRSAYQVCCGCVDALRCVGKQDKVVLAIRIAGNVTRDCSHETFDACDDVCPFARCFASNGVSHSIFFSQRS